MKKVKKVCEICGSEDVLKDAFAEWDFDSQEWVLANVYDHEVCNSCDGETDIIDVDA